MVPGVWKLDYIGICCSIFGGTFGLAATMFKCMPQAREAWVYGSIFMFAVTLVFALQDPNAAGTVHLARCVAFIVFAVVMWGIPFFILLAGDRIGVPAITVVMSHPLILKSTFWIISGAAFVAIGAVFYGTRFPEKYFPDGTFDMVGSSHQIWHVALIIACMLTAVAYTLIIERLTEFGDCPPSFEG